MQWTAAVMIAGLAAGSVLAARRLLHDFQLESYQFRGYFRTVRRQWQSALLPGLTLGLFTFLALLVLGDTPAGHITTAAGNVGLGLWWWRLEAARPEKKPLRLTARIKRLIGIECAVYALLGWGLTVLGLPFFLPGLLPLWLALAALVAWPVERLIYELYFRSARRTLLAQPDLIRVGITGSYGKTSVKFILATMLAEKYQVLATPASFNTPMGLSSVIRSRLQPGTQVFLAEMGARHPGDIRELCRLVHPTCGVLTSVGPQHLDTFKTLERIENTKYDLIRALPPEGCAFFPEDGDICHRLWAKTEGRKRLAGIRAGEGVEVWTEEISVSPAGSRFTLCTAEGKIPCETKLLGEHNIQNIALAASVCLELGLTLQQIARGIAKIAPVEHRLQLLPSQGGMTVIDDAFNANPQGTEAALRVLAQFPPRRIIVTPGLVELGEEEAAFNRRLGERIAHTAEVTILVGPRHTAPIAEGLRSEGFPEESLHITADLNEAAALLGRIGQPGDTVLFENDLPDNYGE